MTVWHSGRESSLLDAIIDGRKTIEGRLNKGKFADYAIDDTVVLRRDTRDEKGILHDGPANQARVRIIAIHRYASFLEMVTSEGFRNVIPTAPTAEVAAAEYEKFYSAEDQQRYGVLAIEVQVMQRFSSIEVIHDMPELMPQKALLPKLATYYDEARRYFPNLPPAMKIYFDNWGLVPEQGTGGQAYSPDIMTVSFDTEYVDKDRQLVFLRQTFLHECFHIAQGFTVQSGKFSGLDSALYEGMATVFERDVLGGAPEYGNYQTTDANQLSAWCDELTRIDATAYNSSDGDVPIWQRWAFYDKESGERWRLYRVGTWLVDRYLAATNQAADHLASVTPQVIREVLNLA